MDKSVIVQVAKRSDLYKLLPFLENRLPDCCEVYLLVRSALLTPNSSYGVYFLRNQTITDEDDYSAIVGIKAEYRLNHDEQIQKVWLLGGWSISDSKLVRVYEAIDRVDWKRDITLAYNRNYQPDPEILRFFNDRQRIKLPFPLIDRYVIDMPDALNLQVNLPSEVYVKSLEHHHAEIVFQTWPYKHLTTLQDVIDEIIQLPSAGIFLKNNDQLVSWMTCHPPNGISRLLTLEEHRRKGYARIVTVYMTKRMAQAGYYPYLNIVAGNSITGKFFQSIGFRNLGPGHVWVTSPPSSGN